MKKIDIKNWQIIWNFTFIKEVLPDISPSRKHRKFKVKCKCWNIVELRLNSILTWLQKSCWCIAKITSSINWKKNKKHWLSNNVIYKRYIWIKNRCNNLKSKDYKEYWWRWIKCEWQTFEEFYKDMWESYKEWLTIDRIDNSWNYCKENCRWTTMKEQIKNRRNSIIINWKTLMQIAQENKYSYQTAWRKYKKINW